MTDEEFKAKVREMGNAELLDKMDCFFGFDPYYSGVRAIITKELERRLNVIVDRQGRRKDKVIIENAKHIVNIGKVDVFNG